MIELKFDEKTEFQGTLCLGFFDSVHIGHRTLIEKAKEFGDDVYVFTFTNDISEYLNTKRGYIYSYEDRKNRFEKLAIQGVLGAYFDTKFMNLTKNEFLTKLSNSLNIKRIVCGSDYTFAKSGEGNVQDLFDYFEPLGIDVVVVPLVKYNGEKVSSSLAKTYLKNGNIKKLNEILVENYFIEALDNFDIIIKNNSSKLIKIKFGSEKVIPQKGKYFVHLFINDIKILPVIDDNIIVEILDNNIINIDIRTEIIIEKNNEIKLVFI